MHMIFTEQERNWIDMSKFGWPIKSGCPKEIKNAIEKKKQIINDQFDREAVSHGRHNFPKPEG